MSRFAAWIEPSILNEWTRLMQAYAERQGRKLEEAKLAAALTFSDPNRDVSLPRQIAVSLLERGSLLHCVWSGRRLDLGVLDIDHCLPWAAWPCGDLWNLMPSHRRVNQHHKRGKLPSDSKLLGARDAVLEWWNRAYLSGEADGLATRFSMEAGSSLPGLSSEPQASIPDAVLAVSSCRGFGFGRTRESQSGMTRNPHDSSAR